MYFYRGRVHRTIYYLARCESINTIHRRIFLRSHSHTHPHINSMGFIRVRIRLRFKCGCQSVATKWNERNEFIFLFVVVPFTEISLAKNASAGLESNAIEPRKSERKKKVITRFAAGFFSTEIAFFVDGFKLHLCSFVRLLAQSHRPVHGCVRVCTVCCVYACVCVSDER